MTALDCVMYLRVSLDMTGDREAVLRHRADCERIIALKGWNLVKVYEDNSISASNPETDRPAYNQMVEDFRAGRIPPRIVCWDLDRLTRQPRQLEDWCDWGEKNGLVLVTANGDADLSTQSGRMIGRFRAAVAKAEIERKSARAKLANKDRAERGLPATGGRRAFGYTQDGMHLVPEEAAALQWAAMQVLSGRSLTWTAQELTRQGFTSAFAQQTEGTKWGRKTGISLSGLRAMLRNPRYAGLRSYNGVVVMKGEWPLIFTPEMHADLVRLLGDPARRVNPRSGRTPCHLLTAGVAHCGTCGSTLNRLTRTGRNPYYRCGTKFCAQAPQHVLDKLVHGLVLGALTTEGIAAALLPDNDAEVNTLRAEADALRKDLEDLDEDFTAGLWRHNRPGYRDAKTSLLSRLDAAEARLRALSDTTALAALDLTGTAEQIAERWDSLHLAAQRAVVKTLFDLTLLPQQGASWHPDKHLRVVERFRTMAEAV